MPNLLLYASLMRQSSRITAVDRGLSFDGRLARRIIEGYPSHMMRIHLEFPTYRSLFSEQTAHPPQDAVLLRVVRVVFAGYFKDGWEGSGVRIDAMAYAVGDLVRKELDI